MKISDPNPVNLSVQAAGEVDKLGVDQVNEDRMAGKKIAIFIQSLDIGGAERMALNLVNGLIQRGVQVDLLLANNTGELLSEVSHQVNIIDLKGKRVLFSLFALVRYLRLQRPDLLYGIQTHASLIAIWAAGLAHIHTPLVISQHTTMSVSLAANPSFRNTMIKQLGRWFFPYADAAICTSQGVADDFVETIGMPRQKTHVVYNPVVSPGLEYAAHQSISHAWFVPGGPAVILAVGRLTAAKDYPTLIRAFSMVYQKQPVRLLILGEGKERAQLESLVRQLGLNETVQMPGFVKNPLAYMARARLLVLSSRWEGFGNVLVEALACGTPVVSTDCKSGPREILENGRFGRLVAAKDPDALAKAILETLQTFPDRTLLRRRAYDFTVEKSVKEHLRIFQSCLLSYEQ
jgi:glycosyltransferase involved in cell wall biosynthesis